MILTYGGEILLQFARTHPDAAKPLIIWQRLIETSDFAHFADLKQRAFGSADYVRPYVVFDIGGNKYRLAALVNYATKTIQVKFVGTHEEYDKGRWRR